MLGLPPTTETNKPLPKTLVYRQFALNAQQRDRFDADISRMTIVNVVSPDTVPAFAAGENVRSFYVLAVSLKRKDYDAKNLVMLARLMPQHLLFVLHYEGEMQLAVFQEKWFASVWQELSGTLALPFPGLDLDKVWTNLVMHIGDFSLQGENTLDEQIRQDEAQAKLRKRIAQVEKRCRQEKQPGRKRELFEYLKQLKQQLV